LETFKVSEIFYSAQGEGRFTGVPSVFFRTFGCNFQCAGFGLPRGQKTTEPDEIDPSKYANFMDLPLVKHGCDSYASWHPNFRKFSPRYTIEESISAMLKLTPNHRWVQDNGNDVHLVITGGEPLLAWQYLYPELLSHAAMRDLSNLTFETNGTQLLHKDFKDYLKNQCHLNKDNITFSVSPKLSSSGETKEQAIKPSIIIDYQDVGHVYLKFVVSTKEDFDEVDQVVQEYRHEGFRGQIYVMSIGGTDESYFANNKQVADMALERGYRYSPRLHVDIWSNGWGK
jgi:organic radical activating enzyme